MGLYFSENRRLVINEQVYCQPIPIRKRNFDHTFYELENFYKRVLVLFRRILRRRESSEFYGRTKFRVATINNTMLNSGDYPRSKRTFKANTTIDPDFYWKN